MEPTIDLQHVRKEYRVIFRSGNTVRALRAILDSLPPDAVVAIPVSEEGEPSMLRFSVIVIERDDS